MSYDLWGGSGGAAVDRTPKPTQTSDKWYVPAESVRQPVESARRLKYQPQKPNKRAAVAVPMAGQSYNPQDIEHQAALDKAARQLAKKKEQHAKFVKEMSLRQETSYKGNLGTDKLWEEEVKERKPKKPTKGDSELTQEQKDRKERAKKLKLRAQAKMGKLSRDRTARKAMTHMRHPDRKVVLTQVDDIAAIQADVDKKIAKNVERHARRIVRNREGQTVQKFGRNQFTPMALDVQTSDQLQGSLRQMQATRVNPVNERMKSLEERNLVPARMRHTYNKRKLLKPVGEIRYKKETVGLLPE